MSKRGAPVAIPAGDDGLAAYNKRQKIAHDVPTGEDVTSSGQLRQLLSFDQDLRRSRHGLQSFKRLLDEIIQEDGHGAKLQILQQYLDQVKPRQDDEDAVYLADIMEMWSFAIQVKNESIMSSVPVVIALVLHIVSDSLTLVKHGLGICQTLLQERQLQSLSSNLSMEKSKAFIISPTLRMLKEAVCIDGGVFAKRIFRARASTFASLGRNLRLGAGMESAEDARRSTIRSNAVRFLLNCLKYLHSEGRKEFLAQREMLSHLTFMIKSDPPHVALDILDCLRSHILADDKIPRDVKSKNFGIKTLVHILGLYTYGTSAQSPEDVQSVQVKAHEFLLYACTTSGIGVLYPTTGLYPRPADNEHIARKPRPENSLRHDHFTDNIPVFNYVLSEFAQKLRPWSNMRHSQLLVAIFKAAPELVAEYFLKNRSFTFEPKLSMTWIGYGAFLFDTMQLPLPPAFGDKAQHVRGPPPTTILLDNIIPPPLNQKTLGRCLTSKSDLTSFFATRLLILALEKLLKALDMLKQGGADGSRKRDGSAWTEASRGLVDAFSQRIPDMKEIVRAYKGIPAEAFLRKTLCSRLLRLYYEAVPRQALAANFDVSPLFVDVLRSLKRGGEGEDEDADAESKEFALMELENLIAIAGYSPGMRWFAKVDSLSSGGASLPLTALLKLLCVGRKRTPSEQILQVSTVVAIEAQLVTKPEGLAVLLQALRCTADHKDVKDMAPIWTFLDNCISRCASSPIKYLELLETEFGGVDSFSTSSNLSLLDIAISEQLSYALSAGKGDSSKALAKFLSLYFTAASLVKSSNASLLRRLHDKIAEQFSAISIKLPELGASSEAKALRKYPLDILPEPEAEGGQDTRDPAVGTAELEALLHHPLPTEEDTSPLVKWSARNVEDLIDDGWAARLVGLLASEHTHIRKEALTNIRKMAAKIKESSYEEKNQVWLLLSEVAESSSPLVAEGPVPSAFTAFTTHSLDVLRNPLHPLYPKVNAYLTRDPVWRPDKLPLAHDVLHGAPSEDDRYYTELTWLLTYLLDALITPRDLDVFRRKGWFEKVLALGANPHLRFNIRTRVLRLVYRATTIEGGSTTLVTRFGIVSWLDAQRAACAVRDEAAVFEGVMRRVWDTCDQTRATQWSRGAIPKMMEALDKRNDVPNGVVQSD